jgi:hypothetical protein
VSRPLRAAGKPLMTGVLAFGAAERYDMVLHPPGTGTFIAKFEWFHWITRKVIATRTVPLVVR